MWEGLVCRGLILFLGGVGDRIFFKVGELVYKELSSFLGGGGLSLVFMGLRLFIWCGGISI